MEQKEIDFVSGKVEIKQFPNGGKIVKVWITPEDVERIKKPSGINLEIKFSKKDNKPYMVNDTWEPTKQPVVDIQKELDQANIPTL